MRTTELLARYTDRRDAEAFAALVQEYKAMVLATCRRRLRSHADVDDAVQETFLKLARNTGSLRANLAAWLHRCAINVSIDLNRRAQTRARHEAAAAPSVDNTEAHRELVVLREQLDAALEALDEPSRELILQRYFVGRSQVDLAAEANVSPSALSQRLDRAIEALRAQLTRTGLPAVAFVGSNEQLTSLLEVEHASAIASKELTASLNAIGVAGVAKVKRLGMLWVAGVGILIAVAVGVWVAGRDSTDENAGTATTSRSRNVTGITAGAGEGPNWQAPQESLQAALFGRVTDEAGNPIANATVDLNGGPSATTDADGQYQIRSIRREADFLAGVSADGFVSIRPFGGEQDLAVRLTPTGRVQRNWVLQRGVSVNVHVVDLLGQPLEMAEVECGPAVAETSSRMTSEPVRLNAEGNGTVFLPPNNKPYVLMATAKNRAPAMLRFTPESIDKPLDLVMELDAGMTIEGVALCNDGKPATGWSISAQPVGWVANSYPIPFAPIDKDGRFTLLHAPPGTHDVGYNIPDGNGMSHGRSLGRFDFNADGAPLKLAVPMKSPGSLTTITGTIQWTGNVRDESVAYGVWIQAQRLDSQRDSYSTSIRGEPPEQSFTITNVEPGEYRISVSGSTFAQVTLERVTVPGELPPIKITVAGKPKLTGTVTDMVTSKPTTNFAYRLRKLQTIGNGPNYVGSTDWVQVNDPAGKFNVDLVGPGEYQVQVSAADRAWVWSAPFRAETQGATVDVKVPLSGGGKLRGVVTDGTGKPLGGAKVIPLSYAQSVAVGHGEAVRFDGEAGAVLTDDSGVYELHHLPAGTETLKVVHPKHAPLRVENIRIVDDQTQEAPAISLKSGGRVEGIIYNDDGSAAEGVPVYFRDRYGYSGDQDKKAGTIAMTTTDSSGHFAVDHLAEETLYVSLSDDSWQRPGVLRRVVRPQEGKTATLDFGGEAKVTGRLVTGAAPMTNAKLALSSGDRIFGAFYAQCTTDTDGRFTLRGVPPGRYVLYTEGPLERIQLCDVNVANVAVDLGEVSDDRGRIVFTIEADDASDLAAVESIALTPDGAATGWSLSFARFRQEGDQWICDEVPSGKSYASVLLKGNRFGGRFAVDRKVSEAESSLSLRIPKRSAILRYTPSTQLGPYWAQVVDVEGTPWGMVGGKKQLDVPLPPGTYHFIDSFTTADLPLPPITVREGQTVELAPPTETFVQRVPVSIWLWTADGALVTNAAATLFDANEVPMTPRITRGQERLSFALEPGHYTLKIDTPDGTPFEQPIEIDPTSLSRNDRNLNVVVQ